MEIMVTGGTPAVPDEEKKLDTEVGLIRQNVDKLAILTNEDFVKAGEFVKEVKIAQKKVEDYWEPMRNTTYSAYRSVMDHKKEMLDPLKKAETTLKRKMSDYQVAQEEKRIEQEKRLKAMAEAEMEKKLREAEEAEKTGDEFGAEYAKAEAEVLNNAMDTLHVAKQETKVRGISQTKSWEITNIDLSKLPDSFAGVLIRPADTKAIMRLIRDSKGNVHIPGVEYQETVNFSVRVS